MKLFIKIMISIILLVSMSLMLQRELNAIEHILYITMGLFGIINALQARKEIRKRLKEIKDSK